jgi:hypothetical protein
LPVRRVLIWRVVVMVALLVLAVIGYVLWIPVHHANAAKLAALATTRPVSGFRADPRTATPAPASSVLASVKAAASSTPGQTGIYTVDWTGKAKDSDASLVVVVTPTISDAKAARADASDAYLKQTSFTRDGFGYGGVLHLRSVPGSSGAYYLGGTSPTITKSTKRTDVAVFRVDRVVVAVIVRDSGTRAGPALDSAARAEYRHLVHVGGHPTLAETSYPAVATVVYAVVTVAVLAAVLLAPNALGVLRRRRQLAFEEALRRERAGRGRKVVKRHAGRSGARRSHARR